MSTAEQDRKIRNLFKRLFNGGFQSVLVSAGLILCLLGLGAFGLHRLADHINAAPDSRYNQRVAKELQCEQGCTDHHMIYLSTAHHNNTCVCLGDSGQYHLNAETLEMLGGRE